MKRLHESSPSLGEVPKLKKIKTNDPQMTTPTEDGGWTKVEKRKQKKAKKVEVKLDVCVFSSRIFPGQILWYKIADHVRFQATQPRFMYNNAEIVKRHHAIGIEVF